MNDLKNSQADSIRLLDARRLRREMTDAEQKLWLKLRRRELDGVKFRRQHGIGPYIVDFCSIERKLIVEFDGGQHASREDEDRNRTAYLIQRGYRVLRFWNEEVLREMDSVLERMIVALRER